MPDVKIWYPEGALGDSTDRLRFERGVKAAVAHGMEAYDPEAEESTRFREDPEHWIGLLMIPYAREDGMGIYTPMQGEISTYGWESRMLTLKERMTTISRSARRAMGNDLEEILKGHLRPGSDKLIAFTFQPKPIGGWAAA